jgi:hypothetical protein
VERIESKQFRDYSQQIDDITFFQGDTITIPFQFIDFDGDVVTLRKTPKSQTYVKWLLCPFGQYQNPLIELKSDSVNSPSGDVYIDDETNIVYVHIDDSKTQKLIHGKYVQQIILYYDFENGNPQKEFRRAQGFVIFNEKIRDYE